MSEGESRELVQRVVLTTTSMDKLLKKLSIISEINQPTNFSSITLVDLIEDVKATFENTISENNIKFSVDCPADLVLYSYPNLVETIISNLIENAFFYSVMKDAADAQVDLKATITNDHVEISVYDNGIGIEDHMSGRLFDMFFKGNEYSKGNGLGLYIVQKSVQTLEGNVEVSSEHGAYTRFVVRLPLKPISFGTSQPALGKAALKQTWLN
jgi:signal transduction histidine kinase